MNIHHPSEFINPEWVEAIRNVAPEAEASGMLHPQQLNIIVEQQWFKLLVPAIYSGLEKSIPELVLLEEAISWANGSVGWVVTLCSGAGWFGGFLNAEKAKAVFNQPNVCLAGSGAPTGEAEITGNGYKINGTWKYASGAHHATHFTANCIIKKDGEAVFNDDSTPLILPFIFDKRDVTVLPAWKYMGMMATGSDAFEVKNLLVEQSNCFEIKAEKAIVKSPLYQYPFLQLAEATLAVNISGMAIHFIDLCKQIFDVKLQQDRLSKENKALLTQILIEQENKLMLSREVFFRWVDTSWADVCDEAIDSPSLMEVSSLSRKLAKTARECADTLYPYCGLIAASATSDINQVWRDLHTASQHALLTFPA